MLFLAVKVSKCGTIQDKYADDLSNEEDNVVFFLNHLLCGLASH